VRCIECVDRRQLRFIAGKDAPQQFDVGAGGGFVQRNERCSCQRLAQVDAERARAGDRGGASPVFDAQGVEGAVACIVA
jgi:hypothetical protein